MNGRDALRRVTVMAVLPGAVIAMQGCASHAETPSTHETTPAATASVPARTGTQTEPFGGKPPVGSTVSVENLDYQVKYQRAFEAVLWSMPAVSMYSVNRATLEGGRGPNVILAWSSPADANLEALTPNTVTPYTTSTTDLRSGPVVVEVPKATQNANLFGQIVDQWFETIADIGPVGVDRGNGAKLLLTPPGYSGEVPRGYIEIKSPSFRIGFAFRSIPTPAGTSQDAYELSRQIKMYYLSELPDPKPTKFVDPVGMRWSTLPPYDERWFEDLYDIVNVEPVRPRDKVMMGMLASLGIEKGKPYAPSDEALKAMRAAVTDAYSYMQQLALTVQPDEYWWPEKRQWHTFKPDENNTFTWDLHDMLDIDARARLFHMVTYAPKKWVARPAVTYLGTAYDATGALMEPGKTYTLTVPKDVPAKQFWSLTVYDRATWAFIYSPEMRSGLSSRDKATMKANADGSVTLYVGPQAPQGMESNWIPTQGKAPYVIFRFYGPTEAYFNHSFVLPDMKPLE